METVPPVAQKQKGGRKKLGMKSTALQVVEQRGGVGGGNLKGMWAVVTGGNSGIGLETARALWCAGAHVVLACRNVRAGEDAVEDIRSTPLVDACRGGDGGIGGASSDTNKTNTLVVEQLDLNDLHNVTEFAMRYRNTYPALHILVLNAGLVSKTLKRTEQGFESHMGVNYVGHYHLTMLLLDVIKASCGGGDISRTNSSCSSSSGGGDVVSSSSIDGDDVVGIKSDSNYTTAAAANEDDNYINREWNRHGYGRIVAVSSIAHFLAGRINEEDFECVPEKCKFSPWLAYGKSKLALILFIKRLARQLEQEGLMNIKAYSVHPGAIHTNLQGDTSYLKFMFKAFSWLCKSPSQGAATTVAACLPWQDEEEDKKMPSGAYLSHCRAAMTSHYAKDIQLAQKVWDMTGRMIEEKLSTTAAAAAGTKIAVAPAPALVLNNIPAA